MVDELDRILVNEEPLVPSAGFTQRVMDALRQSLDYVAPIPFPWLRFAAGLSLALLCAAISAAVLLHSNLVDRALPDLLGAIHSTGWILRADFLAAVLIVLGTLLAVRLSVESTAE